MHIYQTLRAVRLFVKNIFALAKIHKVVNLPLPWVPIRYIGLPLAAEKPVDCSHSTLFVDCKARFHD